MMHGHSPEYVVERPDGRPVPSRWELPVFTSGAVWGAGMLGIAVFLPEGDRPLAGALALGGMMVGSLVTSALMFPQVRAQRRWERAHAWVLQDARDPGAPEVVQLITARSAATLNELRILAPDVRVVAGTRQFRAGDLAPVRPWTP